MQGRRVPKRDVLAPKNQPHNGNSTQDTRDDIKIISLFINQLITYNVLGCKTFLITTKYKAINSSTRSLNIQSQILASPDLHYGINLQGKSKLVLTSHQIISLFPKPQLVALLKLFSFSSSFSPSFYKRRDHTLRDQLQILICLA